MTRAPSEPDSCDESSTFIQRIKSILVGRASSQFSEQRVHHNWSAACLLHGIMPNHKHRPAPVSDPVPCTSSDEDIRKAEAIREAIRRRGSFNMIHLETMFKVDVFISKQRPYDRAQFDRRKRIVIAFEPERSVFVATAEDNILSKLEWYRLGNEASERQWSDIRNVIKTQASRLDVAYLRQWAPDIGVADLLERALTGAFTKPDS